MTYLVYTELKWTKKGLAQNQNPSYYRLAAYTNDITQLRHQYFVFSNMAEDH